VDLLRNHCGGTTMIKLISPESPSFEI